MIARKGETVKAVIRRERYHAHGMMAEWRWLYSVSFDGSAPIAIGTVLVAAIKWAKKRGASEVIKEWEVA